MGVTILRRAATATYKFLGGTMLSFLSSLTVSPPRRPAQGELAVSYSACRLLLCCCSDHNGARWLIPYNKTIPKLRMIDTRPLPYCVSDLATTTTIHNLLTDILGCSHVGQYIDHAQRGSTTLVPVLRRTVSIRRKDCRRVRAKKKSKPSARSAGPRTVRRNVLLGRLEEGRCPGSQGALLCWSLLKGGWLRRGRAAAVGHVAVGSCSVGWRGHGRAFLWLPNEFDAVAIRPSSCASLPVCMISPPPSGGCELKGLPTMMARQEKPVSLRYIEPGRSGKSIASYDSRGSTSAERDLELTQLLTLPVR